ncbi:hypothetical protein [Hymenobacter sp. CRA2]|uniref:hypothetical protein n=1 Tax=Hymenobacter sp. CRA2 TaxID=1955620 RepID=UPI00098FD9D7|nr:hypothetical protein [Hymenobacter sp. CRA2]OON67349.1 hypothetical protein B0919_17935 [Hymenobacter sp. CRA2]
MDDALLAYLLEDAKRNAETIHWPLLSHESQYQHYFPTDTTGRVDSIDLETQLDSVSGQLYVSFTAVTSRMSRLFQQSASVAKWFKDLGEQLRATAVFLHLEAEGYRFLTLQGKPMEATLDQDLDKQHPTTPAATLVLEMCRGYERLYLV